ncbi:hypothetical protein J2S75_003791 [Ancylobacter polymorphus]|uniref:Uncharacterized protein n=1 Tax=Ancylobacter polymorphus TaxID=223390 RepID=A0ABU0BG15_9HYPH|nr:hypothetical protein [Ancylobacter polymorphus]
MLSPVEHPSGQAVPMIVLAHIDGLELRQAEDGWHGI